MLLVFRLTKAKKAGIIAENLNDQPSPALAGTEEPVVGRNSIRREHLSARARQLTSEALIED